MKQLQIAIDFDGTVVTHEFPKVGRDIGAKHVLKRLTEQGHQLILWTMRSGNHLDDAIKWFSDRGIELYGIQANPTQKEWTTSPKAYAQLYIDDAALGAPVTRDANISDRPFIDWLAVEIILEGDGILPAIHEMSQIVRAYMEDNNQKSELE